MAKKNDGITKTGCARRCHDLRCQRLSYYRASYTTDNLTPLPARVPLYLLIAPHVTFFLPCGVTDNTSSLIQSIV